MLKRLSAALAALFVGACDDPGAVTRVLQMHGGPESALRSASEIAVTQFGAPFAGVSPEEVAARLKLPARMASKRFVAVGGEAPDRVRLVLHFNPARAPDGERDCTLDGPVETAPPRAEGFTVTASFCNGRTLLSSGHLEAPRTRADDPEAFAKLMLRLMIEITKLRE